MLFRSETDPALLENLVTRLGAPRWKVLVTCASASLRLKPLSDSDVKQSLEWMKRAVQEIQANPPSDEKLAWIKSIWNETVRNPVFAPVGLSKKIRSESGATNLESEWDSIWQALFDLKN